MTSQGKRLKNIRTALNLSGEEFGKKIGVSRQYVSNLEADRNVLNNEKLVLLSDDLNVNLNYLFTGKGEMFINECENSHALIENPDCISRFNKWGDRLCNLLTENEITPKTFAKLTGINFGRMQAFILDSAEPTMAELNSIKSNVDISLDELLYGEKVVTQNNAFSPDEIAKLKKLLKG